MFKFLLIGNNLKEFGKTELYLSEHFSSVSFQKTSNPEEVFDLIYKNSPDVILLEQGFNENRGTVICHALKNKNVVQHIPVVMIIEKQTSGEERIKGLMAGADSIISKPVEKAELVAIVSLMLRIKDAEDKLRKKNKELKLQVLKKTNELELREKKYSDMFDAAANIIILIGRDKTIEEWNRAAEILFEADKQSVLGKDFEIFLTNKVMRADILERFSKKNEGDEKREYQITMKTASGKKYQILWTISHINDSKNQLTSILVIGQDVSQRVLEEQERKRSEARLRSNYLFLNTLLNTIPSPVYYKDTDGRYLGCNSEYADFYGLKPEEVVGKLTWELVSKEILEDVEKEDSEIYRTGIKQIKEKAIKDRKGIAKHFMITKTAFYKPDQSIGGMVGVMTNITRLKQMEESLRDSEMFFKGITDSANDAIILADKNNKIHFWNNAAETLFGFKKEEIMNKSLFQTILKVNDEDDLSDKLWELSRKSNLSAHANILEVNVIHKNRIKFYAEFSISGIELHNKKFIIIIAKNISTRKQTEQALREAKDKAEEADRLKSAFLSNMSHEIRTPMNAIVGFSQLLINSSLDEKKRQLFIEQINLNSESLLKLIEDIIYVSKIEAGKVEITESMVLLNTVLDELYTSFLEHKRRMGKDHLALNLVKSVDNVNFSILTDVQRFKQILSNLIGNALKFTETGSVTFGYEVKDKDYLLFFVKDTGLGINPAKLEYVFDRFTKISAGKTKLYGGTGLGLSITQNLVEMLGGKIWVESTENRGSEFFFQLPYQGVQQESSIETQDKSESNSSSLKSKVILIAEDEQMNYFFLQEALNPTGVKLIWAKNGKEAVHIVESHEKIDLVLMDMKLPIMDGYDATMLIKKLKPSLPVIAQTAYAMPDEQKKGYQAGCDFYLSKPIDPAQLIDTINKFIFPE
ncbi:MAG: PAS domain S-box protein [Bacteroidales bacterium]